MLGPFAFVMTLVGAACGRATPVPASSIATVAGCAATWRAVSILNVAQQEQA
jgi:hypothetical protein